MSSNREEFIKSLRVENNNDNNKPKLKNKPSKVRWIAGMMAALSLSMALTSCRDKNVQEIEDNTSVYEETQMNENIQKDLIKNVGDVEKDFIDKYLKAYNEKYKTNYETAQLNVVDIGYAYQVETSQGENFYVTHGSLPYETEKYLQNYGEVTKIPCEHVLQILVGEEVLETYSIDLLNKIKCGQSLESGNQLDGNFEEHNLQELVDLKLARLASNVKLADGAESKESINLRIAEYKARVNQLNKTEQEQGIEIGD